MRDTPDSANRGLFLPAAISSVFASSVRRKPNRLRTSTRFSKAHQRMNIRQSSPLHGRPCWHGVCLLVALVLVILVLPGCQRRDRSYSQATPDDVIRSAAAMVKNGETRRLTELIYADSPEMRSLLQRLGRLFERTQSLSRSVEKRWPEEYAKLQSDALAAAQDPKNKGLLTQLISASGQRRSNRSINPDDLRAAFSAFLADPYGWLDRGQSRISTTKIADDTAAVLFDGEPAIPVVGLMMKQEAGKWYIVLPTNAPGIANVWPRAKEQYDILGSAVKVIDNSFRDLATDVDAGRVSDIKNLTDKLQEKSLFPLAIAFAAYGKELDIRERTDRRVQALRKRVSDFAKARRQAGQDDESSTGLASSMREAFIVLGQRKIERSLRANKPLQIADLSDRDFEDFLAGLLTEMALGINFADDLGSPDVEKKAAAWLKAQQKPANPPPVKRP